MIEIPRKPTDRTRAKILVEQEIDRYTKERKEFFLFRDCEAFGSHTWNYYNSRIKSHATILRNLRERQRILYGNF